MSRYQYVFQFLFAFLLSSVASTGWAQSDRLDDLYAELRKPDLPNWQAIEDEIWREWSKSGSAAMDLLLQRGIDAADQQDWGLAIEHLTALTDHAPDFAQGWSVRATAFFKAEAYGQALADIRQALSLNPRDFVAIGLLAGILELTGKPQQALDAYRAAHSIHPHHLEIKEAIERLERSLGDVTL